MPTPVAAQIAGEWTGTSRYSSATGGECVGVTIRQSDVGGPPTALTASIQQTDSTLKATVTNLLTGTTCSYSGTAQGSSVTLNSTNCPVNAILEVGCANGALRDVVLIASSITGSVTGNVLTGTETDSFNVLVSGTTQNVGSLSLASTFSMSK